MNNFRKSITAFAVTAALGVSGTALANNTNGYITGNSVTTSGDVLSNVAISIENIETGLKRAVVSSADGSFRFPLLPPGRYKVVAEKNLLVVKGCVPGHKNSYVIIQK